MLHYTSNISTKQCWLQCITNGVNNLVLSHQHGFMEYSDEKYKEPMEKRNEFILKILWTISQSCENDLLN